MTLYKCEKMKRKRSKESLKAAKNIIVVSSRMTKRGRIKTRNWEKIILMS